MTNTQKPTAKTLDEQRAEIAANAKAWDAILDAALEAGPREGARSLYED